MADKHFIRIIFAWIMMFMFVWLILSVIGCGSSKPTQKTQTRDSIIQVVQIRDSVNVIDSLRLIDSISCGQNGVYRIARNGDIVTIRIINGIAYLEADLKRRESRMTEYIDRIRIVRDTAYFEITKTKPCKQTGLGWRKLFMYPLFVFALIGLVSLIRIFAFR